MEKTDIHLITFSLSRISIFIPNLKFLSLEEQEIMNIIIERLNLNDIKNKILGGII